jgi:hypothetical protein
LDHQAKTLWTARDLERLFVAYPILLDQFQERLIESLHPIVLAFGDGRLDLPGLFRVYN